VSKSVEPRAPLDTSARSAAPNCARLFARTRGARLALRRRVPLRFTTLAAILTLAAPAAAQPAPSTDLETCEESTTCEPAPDPLDAPWNLSIAAGGLVGVPTALEAEVGLRAGHVYAYASMPWMPKSVIDAHLLAVGVDGVFGRRSRGFAGLGSMISVGGDPGDDDLVSAFARIGANAPISRHVSLRAWTSLGLGRATDRCGADPDCDNATFPVPLLMLHLAVAYRL
jgi:hypothetical protein